MTPILSTQHMYDLYSNSYAVQPAIAVLPMSEDAYMRKDTPTVNNGTATTIQVGEDNTTATNVVFRSWIKPDFSAVAPGRRIVSAVLKLTPTADLSSNARTLYACRCLMPVVVGQITWNIAATGVAWNTVGGSHATLDYDGTTPLGTMTMPVNPTLNVAMPMDFTAAGIVELQKIYDGTYTNNGILLFVDTQLNDRVAFAATEHATSAYRPTLTTTFVL